MNDRAGPRIPPFRQGPIVLGIAASALVRFGVGAIPVRTGEPIALRWARVLADHPVRAALAAALVVIALRPRPISLPTAVGSAGEDSKTRSSH